MARSHSLICVVCDARVPIVKGALLVECVCGKEDGGLTGQPVEEPICELLARRRPSRVMK